MKRTIPLFASILIGILIVGPFPSFTSACSCVELPSVKEEFNRSKAVFSGKVIDIKEKRSSNGYLAKSILFEVTNTWKGIHQSQITITTGISDANCGFDFKNGKEYLVYANESTMYGAKSLVTIICDRTNELSSSKEDLMLLGKGQPPNEEVDLTDKHEAIQLYMWAVMAVIIGILFIFIFNRRKKK